MAANAVYSSYFAGNGVPIGLMKSSSAGYVAGDKVYAASGLADGWAGSEVTQIIQSGRYRISRAEGPMQTHLVHTQYTRYSDTRAYCNWNLSGGGPATAYLSCDVDK